MSRDMHEKRASRRAFLTAAGAGAASLAFTAGEQPAVGAAKTNTLAPPFAITCGFSPCRPGSITQAWNRASVTAARRMTPAEGAFYLNIPNLLLIRSNNLPRLPDSEHGRARNELPAIRHLVSAARPGRLVGRGQRWSGRHGRIALRPVAGPGVPQYRRHLPGRFHHRPEERGRRPPDRASRLAAQRTRAAREKLKSLGRPMDVWVTLYTHEVNPKHPGTSIAIRRWPTFSTSSTCLRCGRGTPTSCRSWKRAWRPWNASPPRSGASPWGVPLGLPHSRPVPLEFDAHQCELGLKWLKEKRIQEMIFLANTVLDVGLPSAEFARNWIAKVGAQTI